VLRKIFETKGENVQISYRKLLNRMRARQGGSLECVSDMKNVYISVWSEKLKRSLGRRGLVWVYDIKMDLKGKFINM
jgi:hypothetical protein